MQGVQVVAPGRAEYLCAVPRSLLLVLLALTGCRSTTSLHVRVALPAADGTVEAARGVPLVALPYDRDSVIAALAARAASPRPDTSALDSLFGAFQRPFVAFAASNAHIRQLQDSLTRLKSQLDSMSREAAGYRVLYGTFVTLTSERTLAEHQRDSLQRSLSPARGALGPRADSLKAALRAWEDSTYRDYEQITQDLTRQSGRSAVTDTTSAQGTATLVLRKGRWWLYARSWDVADPNAEWYWNLPVQGDSITLTPANARHRPRY
jgi:hypothetical protein